MRKILVLVICVAATSAAALIKKDQLYTLYLQNQVNAQLTVEDNQISFCGISAHDKESPQALVDRLRRDFNPAALLRDVIALEENIFKDTPEIEALNDTISKWGYQETEELEENLKFYLEHNRNGVFDELEQTTADMLHFRKTSGIDIDQTKDQRNNLQIDVFLERKQVFETNLHTLLSEADCLVGGTTFVDVSPDIMRFVDRRYSEDEVNAIIAEHTKIMSNHIMSAEPELSAFTKKVFDLVNDISAEMTLVDETTEVNEASIKRTIIASLTKPLGKKELIELGCSAYGIPYNEFGSARLQYCYLGEDEYTNRIYLHDANILVEEHDIDDSWNIVKRKLLANLK
ncbi:hypothetical protein [Thaumasiovibrio subtropicus]|uniref:hypothetical protein n=1 Tax=Thaumasiovibrio subtropicus TaxID=1891207 RepID=UPI000B351DFA|nr:hypothetical protein [Thaumasiovibrio subtropicus]